MCTLLFAQWLCQWALLNEWMVVDVSQHIVMINFTNSANLLAKLLVKGTFTWYSASLWIITSKRSGMACVLKGSHSFSCTHTYSIRNQNEPYLCLPSYSWYSFTYFGGMEGWIGLGGWLRSETIFPKAVTHPTTNRAQCSTTVLIKTNALQLWISSSSDDDDGDGGGDGDGDWWLVMVMVMVTGGDGDWWFQCQLIVAHLKQTDAEDWYALGQEFQEMNNIEQALFCYDRGWYCRHFCLLCILFSDRHH